jgi:hypothetical protein
MCDGLVAVEVRAAVRKGIGRDIDDPHDQRALAEFERARAQAPLEDCSHRGRF